MYVLFLFVIIDTFLMFKISEKLVNLYNFIFVSMEKLIMKHFLFENEIALYSALSTWEHVLLIL